MQVIFNPEGGEADEAALRQIASMEALPYVRCVVGLPDLHPGKGGPVGAAVLVEFPIPVVVGNDIGCGFTLARLSLKSKRLADPEWIASRLDGLDGRADDDIVATWSRPRDGDVETTIGTIGGGNHFAEISLVYRADVASGLTAGDAVLLVHSGSRSLGENLYRDTVAVYRDDPIRDPEAAATWMARQAELVDFASRNRAAVVARVADALNVDSEIVSDVPHNFVEKTPEGYLHRKGASTASMGLVVMAGTRSTPSYLLRPLAFSGALMSLPHGAGRRLTRSAARGTNMAPESFRRGDAITAGGHKPLVVCGDPDLLLEERAGAYRDASKALAGAVNAGMAEAVAEFHPVVTFKVSEVAAVNRDRTRTPERRARDKERKAWR